MVLRIRRHQWAARGKGAPSLGAATWFENDGGSLRVKQQFRLESCSIIGI